MTNQHYSYRQIMKATSIFGGVQIVKIITNIISSKVIAILLGPSGMGIVGLFNSTISFISSLSNFGLTTSAVKNISSASSYKQIDEISFQVALIKKLIWFTGLLGTISTLLLSKYISVLTFGSDDFTTFFVFLSFSILINQISNGQIIILQGLRMHKQLANAIITGSILGLLFSLPFYYFLGVNGIVPAMLIVSLMNLFRSWYFTKDIVINKTYISFKQAFLQGKEMLLLGFFISLSGIITNGFSYFTKLFISKYGTFEEVGFYNAGFILVNGYVGLVFSAMATDYFPKLSFNNHDNKYLEKTINEQSIIMLLLLPPIIILFFLLNKFIIVTLYSKQFLVITNMILFSLIGIYIRAIGWSISFVFIAKGDSKLFFWNELFANVYFFLFNIILYIYYGLDGLGISFSLGYLIYFFHMNILLNSTYKIQIGKDVIRILLINLILILISLFFHLTLKFKFLFIFIIFTFTTVFCLYELNKKVKFKEVLIKYLK
ncbi:MAG: oligosaccharide flippase family protein [Spirochaetales bacterium]|nr:oligosaccharide flippase family protein [Spirochaetales bacterium]